MTNSSQTADLVTDAGSGISTIDTLFQRPGLVASHIVQHDGHVALIDVGTTSCAQTILDSMQHLSLQPEQVDAIIITHVHLDHAGAAGYLMDQFPNATLIVHPRGARHMINPEKLIAGAAVVYGADMMRDVFGEIVSVAPDRVIEAADGYEYSLAGRVLEFLDTPGHARHHFCIYDKLSNGFFTGDTFGLSYREFDTAKGPFMVPTTTPVQFDPVAFHQSIDRLMGYQPQWMYLTHFGRIPVTQAEATQLHAQIDLFVELAERVEREGRKEQGYLIELMREALVSRLRQHGCQLPLAEINRLMDMDLGLNSQGLLYWLDHKQ